MILKVSQRPSHSQNPRCISFPESSNLRTEGLLTNPNLKLSEWNEADQKV